MLALQFLVPVVAGVVFLFLALVLWMQGQRRRSLALRWWSLACVALALSAGFAAVKQLANPRTFDLWGTLQTAAWFLATCMLVVAVVYVVREEMQRGSGMHG